MFGLSRTKTVRALRDEVLVLKDGAVVAEGVSRRTRVELATQLTKRSVAEAQRRAAEEESLRARTNLKVLKDSMPKRFRVGWVDLEPTKLTTQLRGAIDADLRVDYDGYRLWVSSGRPLSEAESNAVQSKLPFKLDTT